MDDVSAGIIDDSPVVEKPPSPETESSDSVRENQPERNERHPSFNIHSPEKRSSEKDNGDSRESKLEYDQSRHRIKRFGHGSFDCAVIVEPKACGDSSATGEIILAEGDACFAPEGEESFAEGHAVGAENPDDEDGGEGVESHES